MRMSMPNDDERTAKSVRIRAEVDEARAEPRPPFALTQPSSWSATMWYGLMMLSATMAIASVKAGDASYERARRLKEKSERIRTGR